MRPSGNLRRYIQPLVIYRHRCFSGKNTRTPNIPRYKPVRTYDGEQPESEPTERHIQRLLKAGFVEVEPVGSDWQFFAFRERLRNMSPYEIVQEWQEIQRASRERLGISEKSFGEILGELTFAVFDMLMRLLLGLPPEEEEKQKAQSSH